ncbi:MAG: RecBCD enzyme subunit RecC [Chlamydiae bacterium]|nr:RecBCD enzyme subunit RecC [Chlamydiota bacterium]
MNGNFCVHSSNQMEILFTILKNSLFSDSRPFTQRLLVVPSPIMRSWILWKLATDPDLSVAMGIEMTYINQVIGQLAKGFPETERGTLASQFEMALAIEHEIKQIILKDSCDDHWQPLRRFLQTSSPFKSARRLTQLATELANLFMQYGLYAGPMIKNWSESGPKDWQEALFLQIYKNHPKWTTPHEELSSYFNKQAEPKDMQVHLFGLNFLSALHHQFFKCVSQTIPVHYYLLSPCEQYWGDVTSDSELRHIRRQWRKKGIQEEKQQEMEEYFQDRNVLLANLGRLGRKMMFQIEDDCDDGVFEHVESPKDTLLSQLQNDMLVLRPTTEKQEIDDISTIQVHVAPTRRREIQILYNNLMHLIHLHGYLPSDVIVMAPDITDYVPYIKAMFDNPEQPLDFQIYDLKMSSQSSVVQGFQSLIQLSKSRWDVVSMLQFLEIPEVMRKHGLSQNDVAQFREWVMETRIRWGSDVDHRNELLKSSAIENKNRTGTWEHGIERLLFGLSMSPDDENSLHVVPYEAVEMSQAPLLGKLIHLIRSLREDLKPLSECHHHNLHHWTLYLRCLYEAYFRVDKKDDEALREEEQLLGIFERFHLTKEFDQSCEFSWNTINAHLEQAFSEQSMNFKESHVQAVKFCSMLPMRAIPAKVVILMGMEEGVFPKKEVRSPLNKMIHNSLADYVPSSRDFDRYLFLEALLSARDYFIMSYTKDSQEKKPSLLITELLNTLDHSYTHKQKPLSEICVIEHPFSSFHKKYFERNENFFSYSFQDYAASKSLLQPEKKTKHFMSELFQDSESKPKKEESLVTLTQLFKCAKNPLRTYFNQALGIMIKDDESLTAEDHFVMNSLEEYQLKTEALKNSLDDVIKRAEGKGRLPQGLFKDLSVMNFRGEGEALKNFLESEGISESDFLSVELNEHSDTIQMIQPQQWQIPAIKIDNHVVVGKMDSLTKEGLCIYNKESVTELFAAWPKILILNCISEILPEHLSIKKQLIFLKSKTKIPCDVAEPFVWLKKYIDYYHHCLDEASPLLPEWIQDIFKGEKLEETINKSLQNQFKQSYNKYLLWCLREKQIDELDTTYIEKWKEKAFSCIDFDHELFSKLKIKK